MGSIVKNRRNIIGVMTMSRDEGSNFVYLCTRCGMEFAAAEDLETHFSTHNNEPSNRLDSTLNVVNSENSASSRSTQSAPNENEQRQ